MISTSTPPIHPSHSQLQAAYYVARMLGPDGESRSSLERSYRSLATGALHDHLSLADGEHLLLRVGLLSNRRHLVVPTPELVAMTRLPLEPFVETLLFRILTSQREVWLAQMATTDEVRWELVPYDVATALTSTLEDLRERDALLLSAARKVDLEVLQEFGDEGELAVLTACREHLVSAGLRHMLNDVAHVSVVDDTVGYDISSPDASGQRHRLEVKATSAPPGWVEFFISRNEATVAERDPRWSLIVTRREPRPDAPEPVMQVAGWLTYSDFSGALPADPLPDQGELRGRWASCRVTLSARRLRPGLPLQRPQAAG
ncbi:DUF3883 domain-containing protein [Micromonospora sp. Llam7]|uniref:protein NO VEIN domain-containing protein n=1 Tax=Micromonospora tarapacensis TaxID=2835305 RepID=UPI001C833D1E|nr:DUF3883 domain-containing protein [Micromonospora tarapacensis]MBX7270042.1 DUF3883 domain-containing protein [Micromonospora tarapacensis]